jgi:tetratricopeptide (TPR) repeat protein
MYSISTHIFKHNWLAGAGPGNFGHAWPDAQRDYLRAHPNEWYYYSEIDNSHNMFIQMFVDYGIFGGTLFLCITLFAIISFIKLYRKNNNDMLITKPFLFVAYTGILTDSLFSTNYEMIPVAMILYFILGVLINDQSGTVSQNTVTTNRLTHMIKPGLIIVIILFSVHMTKTYFPLMKENFYYHRFLVFFDSQDPRAEQALDKLITINPANRDYLYLKSVLLNQRGDNKTALSYLIQSSTGGYSLGTYFELARTYSIMGDYKSAIEWYEKLLQYRPNYRAAMNNLANDYVRNGDKKKGVELMKQIVKIYPKYAKVKQNLDQTEQTK